MSTNHLKILLTFLTCMVFLVGPANSARKSTGQNAAGDEVKSAELSRVGIIKANSGSYDQAINFFEASIKASGKNHSKLYCIHLDLLPYSNL